MNCFYASYCPIPDDVFAFANLSAEAPDQDVYIAMDFGTVFQKPPLGADWRDPTTGVGTGTGKTPTSAANNAHNNQIPSGLGYNPDSGTVRIPSTDANAPGSSGSGGQSGAGRPSGVGLAAQPVLYSNNDQSYKKTTPGGCDSTVTIPAGTITATSLAMANRIAQSMAQKQANKQAGGLKVTNCSNMPRAKCQHPYDFQYAIEGGTPPYTVTISGLPNGLSMDKTGHITGTPTGPPSSQALTLTIQDSGVDDEGNPAPVTCEMTCVLSVDGPCIYPCASLNGVQCTPFSCQFTSIPSNCKFTASGLPNTVVMEQNGLLHTLTSGPNAGCLGGSFDTTVTATDTDGESNSISVHITAAPNPALGHNNGLCPSLVDSASVADLQWCFVDQTVNPTAGVTTQSSMGTVSILSKAGCQADTVPGASGVWVASLDAEAIMTLCACKPKFRIAVDLQWDVDARTCPGTPPAGGEARFKLSVGAFTVTDHSAPGNGFTAPGGLGALFTTDPTDGGAPYVGNSFAFIIFLRTSACKKANFKIILTEMPIP